VPSHRYWGIADRSTVRYRRKCADHDDRKPTSVNKIRTAIDELTARAELVHKEGRDAEGAEIERRIQGYRDELGRRP